MQLKKGQKRPKVFTLELMTLSNSDENDTTVIGIFSTVATAKRFLKHNMLDEVPLMKKVPNASCIMYMGTNEKEGFGYRIVKYTVDGRL